MINRKIASTVAALFCSTALVGGLAACSSDDDSSSDPGSSTTTAARSTTGAESTGSESSGGDSSITVDGTKWEGTYTARCAKLGDILTLSVADVNGTASKGAAVTLNADGSVDAVALGDPTSGGLGAKPGIPNGGTAEVSQDGNTYTITGEAVGIDLSNPTEPTKSEYEIVAACETITGS